MGIDETKDKPKGDRQLESASENYDYLTNPPKIFNFFLHKTRIICYNSYRDHRKLPVRERAAKISPELKQQQQQRNQRSDRWYFFCNHDNTDY